MIVILSYRENWEHRCGRSCNCLHASGNSGFEMHLAESVEGAAEFISKQCHADPDASYIHYVFNGWKGILSEARRGYSQSPNKGENSIVFPYFDEDDFDGDYDACEAEQQRANSLISEVRALVTDKLGKLSEAAKQKEREEQNRLHREANAKRAEKEYAEYQRLKQQFEG